MGVRIVRVSSAPTSMCQCVCVCVLWRWLAYRWPVRSPDSSLAPATVCPIVTVKGFPETPTARKKKKKENMKDSQLSRFGKNKKGTKTKNNK